MNKTETKWLYKMEIIKLGYPFNHVLYRKSPECQCKFIFVVLHSNTHCIFPCIFFSFSFVHQAEKLRKSRCLLWQKTNFFHSCVEKLNVASLYMQIRIKQGPQAELRTLTSSLFPALKFIEKRTCFFKISLAVISGSVHCCGNRKRVEIDIRGPGTSRAYHQRSSCRAGSTQHHVP